VTGPLHSLVYQEFDSDAFAVPFFRVIDPHSSDLVHEIEAVTRGERGIIDAKLPAEDIEAANRLLRAGFRKICCQVELHHDVVGGTYAPVQSGIFEGFSLPEEMVSRHAANFTFDRFSLDNELPPGHQLLFERWIRNSLGGRTCLVAAREFNFITFKLVSDQIKIDLVSVLDKGRGIARDLLHAILWKARELRLREVVVVTECENKPAVNLYLKKGFKVVQFYSVFHLVKL
jgi:hypothetical protein